MLIYLIVYSIYGNRLCQYPALQHNIQLHNRPGDLVFSTMSRIANALRLSRLIVPPLLPQFYKGQLGRVLVLGGEYSGAVFYAADASAKVGADLVHVVCSQEIAPVIRGYTPDLMVHPFLENDVEPGRESQAALLVMDKVKLIMDRVDVVAVGSGLGRGKMNLEVAEAVIKESRRRTLPLVLDADLIFLLSQKPELIKGYQHAILTPNKAEFRRLWESLGGGEYTHGPEAAMALSKKLGGVTIVAKGTNDIIAKNDNYAVNDTEGSLRRCGGQGDTLCGSISIFYAWGKKYGEKLWEHENEVDPEIMPIVAAYGASSVVRHAGHKAFAEKHRAMQALDIHLKLGESFDEFYDGIVG